MPIIAECHDFLKKNATGEWFETYRFKSSDDYIHPVGLDMVLLQVEKQKMRAFYWIHNIGDANAFNQFVGLTWGGEAHEVIIANTCRFFYDIDLKLDACEQDEAAEYYSLVINNDNEYQVMDEVGKQFAAIYKEATLISLEEHGNDPSEDLCWFDWMFTMRNRRAGSDFKISIHIVTNIFILLCACAAVANDVKHCAIPNNVDLLGITPDMAKLLAFAIDNLQYRSRESLGLPFGVKYTEDGPRMNRIYREYNIPGQHYMSTIDDQFTMKSIDTTGYDIQESFIRTTAANPDFVKEALKHVRNTNDYDPRV